MKDIWDELRARLSMPHSNIRDYDGVFLMYIILDSVVDALSPLSDAYRHRLVFLQQELKQQRYG